MDYVTNNAVVEKQQRPQDGGIILAYDMAFAKLREERKGKKKHA